MASPVITTVDVVYPNGLGYKEPGQPVEVFINATDSDNIVVEIAIKVTDTSGNESTGTATFVQQDKLTYAVTAPTGYTVTQDPAQSNHFFIV